MNANRHSRGSVLMEFIIVLPIYLVLFGGVFMIGDMGIHATRLASADRAVAFDLQMEGVKQQSHGWPAIQDRLFHVQASDDHEIEIADDGDTQDSLFREDNGGESYQYADASVDCPWSLQAAMRIRDNYKLLVGGTAGRLLFATTFIDDTAPAVDGGSDTSTDTFYMDLIGGENRVGMYSKDMRSSRTYTYNYYTLKRTAYKVTHAGGENRGYTWRDNRRYASDLVVKTLNGRPDENGTAHAWKYQVYDEKWHDGIYPAPDKNKDPENFPRGSREDYTRYSTFRSWSD